MSALASVNFDDTSVVYLKICKNVERASAHAAQCAIVRAMLSDESLNGVVASPQPGDVSKIVVIGLSTLLGNSSADALPPPTFATFCDKHQLQIVSRDRPDGIVVERCFRFSMNYWLEKQGWYRIGDALIQSSFLGKTDRRERYMSVDVGVHCGSDGDLFLNIRACLFRLSVMETCFHNSSFDQKWAVCLPKLGRGTVFATYRSIPDDAPFKNWAEMRYYWLNAYGYTLPETEPEAYYEVRFNGLNHTFLYPYYCVLSCEPEEGMHRDSAETRLKTRDAFIHSLNNCHVTVCGSAIHLEEEEGEASARLSLASVMSLPPARRDKKRQFTTKQLRPIVEKKWRPCLEGEGSEWPEEGWQQRWMENKQGGSYMAPNGEAMAKRMKAAEAWVQGKGKKLPPAGRIRKSVVVVE